MFKKKYVKNIEQEYEELERKISEDFLQNSKREEKIVQEIQLIKKEISQC